MYTYDNAGNRLSKKTYAYTTGTPGNATATESYNYTGDRLTQVGSTVYQYDAIGNPTTYNGYTLEWNGRKLMEMSMNGGQFLYTFAYNADGIRTVKTNGSTIHHYTLNGSQIVTETWTTKSSSGAETPNHFLVYLYDENGAPVGLQYRNKTYGTYTFDTYYFEKNLQGDIIAIYTENGTKIGSYTYDAWGNCTVSTESGATTSQKRIVRTLNPFRYRGYYYDTDTGLYYLQSRYYNPQWGRFLNADGYVNANGTLTGYNMYAYCDNNPVNGYDPAGKWTISTGYNISAFLIGGFTWSVNISFDSSGNIAIQTTKANVFEKQSGAIIGPASAGVSRIFSVTNCDTVDDLEGIFYNYGASANVYGPVSAGLEANFTPDDEWGGITVSGGVGAGVDIHASATNTETVFKFNPVEWIKGAWKKIKGVFA